VDGEESGPVGQYPESIGRTAWTGKGSLRLLDERPAGGRNTIQDRQRRRNKQRAIHDQNLDIASRLVARWRRYEFLYNAFQRRLRIVLNYMRMAADNTFLSRRSCSQPSLLRRSAGRSYSLLFFPAPFIFQFLHIRQPARRFLGRPRL